MSFHQDHDDAMFELFAASDYKREAYGDPCPGCGTLRWQADCPTCMPAEEEEAPEWATLRDGLPEWPSDPISAPAKAAKVPALGMPDDDIPF